MKDTNNAIDALNRLKSEGANTEAVRVLDGFVRSAARGAPLGSGDIREAFEAWYSSRHDGFMPSCNDGEYDWSDAQSCWEAWQAALQSQTAPAVPEWTDKQCIEFMCHALRHVVYSVEGDSPTCDDIRLGVKAAMLAAPQPDHSPDGGEVGPVGWIWETYGQRNFTAGTHHKNVLEADGLTLIPVYTHPAQPRNEVQAEALEGFIDEITKQIGYLENKSEQARTLRKVNSWLIKCAARLRSNGGEG